MLQLDEKNEILGKSKNLMSAFKKKKTYFKNRNTNTKKEKERTETRCAKNGVPRRRARKKKKFPQDRRDKRR